MATTASLDLTVWRNDDVFEWPLRVRGVDLTGVDLAMQIRLYGDAPGAALVDLRKVTDAAAQGLRLAGVTTEAGIPVSDVRVRIGKAARQALPYMGTAGQAAQLRYALLIGGITRLVGSIVVPAHAFGSDSAPRARLAATDAGVPGLPSAGATLTIAADQMVELAIDGAGEMGNAILKADAAASAAQRWAEGEMLPEGRSSRSWAREAELKAAASSTAAGIAAGFVGGVMYATVAAGLAATAADGFFTVRGENAAIYARLYRKVNGAAVEQTYLAGGLGLAMIGQRADKGRVFDITDYGAIGDGITNDTQAIRTAMRMCALAGGGTVFYPKTSAFYSIADPERTYGTIGGGAGDPPFKRGIIELLPGVHHASDGAELRVSGGRTTPGSLFYQSTYPTGGGAERIDDISFTGLHLNGNIRNQVQPFYPKGFTDDNRVWQHGHAIAIFQGRGLRITGCKIEGFWGNGVTITCDSYPAFDARKIPGVAVDIKIMHCEFKDLFGIGVCGVNVQGVEVAHCYFHGDGFWVGAITPETIFDHGMMLDWNIHDNVFDFRDGTLPIESALFFTSSTDPAGKQYLKSTRRALCAILAYQGYTGDQYNEHMKGIKFTDNTVYQGVVQIYNFSVIDVSRNNFYNFYEDLTGIYLAGSTAIEIGSYASTNGLRDARIHDNTIEHDMDGYGLSVMRMDDVSVRGNLITKARIGSVRSATSSGTFAFNRHIDVTRPITDADFAKDPNRNATIAVYGGGSRPLTFFSEEFIETRTGAARAMRHGVVINTAYNPKTTPTVRLCSAVGLLGKVAVDTGGDYGPVHIWGCTEDGDETFRTNRGMAAKSMLVREALDVLGGAYAKSLEIKAPKGERAGTSYTIDGKLALQINADTGDGKGSVAFQKFDVSTGILQNNPIVFTQRGALGLNAAWELPILLNGNLRLWAINSRLYTKFAADPTGAEDGSQIVQRVAVPDSATATGTFGQVAWDASYFYTCTGPNQWRRSAIATW